MTLVQLLLPVWDHTGQPFPRNAYATVRQELVDEFGGLTAYTRAPAQGLWAEQGDQAVKDDIVVYEVMAGALDHGWWARYRRRLETRFAQRELVIRALAAQLL